MLMMKMMKLLRISNILKSKKRSDKKNLKGNLKNTTMVEAESKIEQTI